MRIGKFLLLEDRATRPLAPDEAAALRAHSMAEGHR